MNNFFRLNLYLTIKSPDGKDVLMTASRTLPFQPVEGLVLMLPLCEGIEDADSWDAEYPITLGVPTYSYLESAFVETQEDDTAFDIMRDGTPLVEAVKNVVKSYEAYGFRKAK